MRWTVPNVLTILRLVAAPGLAVMFMVLIRPYADWGALILFVAAAVTDWFDGYLARAWHQQTKLGAMLDPIADKAMVMIALLVIVGYSSLATWLVIPATIILFREVFVSGLREYLGETTGTLKVKKLAKWKTTAQMVAIAVLFAHGIFEHYLDMVIWGMNDALVRDVFEGRVEDVTGVLVQLRGMKVAGWIGLVILWIAAGLTLITGLNYARKALQLVRETT
ncbi:MAG: CDP-diacylglycerol--glycerol-3-phosphate 3-phosphatidyltransferase [Rhodobacteraceae bacterium]|nr:CDP-diacylglycerol--glycerol-3-phosphate 3-phosphatidyltransferase [Paracoccaceae bacterium]